jgi:hypothetical protein
MTTPIVDDLDAAYAEIRREPYAFRLNGRDWILPHIQDLDYRVLADIETMNTADVPAILSLFNRMFDPEQAAAWADTPVPNPVLFLLFERWLAHGGAQSGEDSASSGSSGSTGKSSRRTSGGSTGSGSRASSSAKKAAPKKRAPRKAVTVQADGLAGSPPGNS